MNHSISSWLVLTLLACTYCDAFKILAVFPMPAKSHIILGDGIVRHLSNAGHEITYITPVKKKTQPSNVKHIDVSENYDVLPKFENFRSDEEKELNAKSRTLGIAVETLNIKGIMNKEVSLETNDLLAMMVGVHNATYHNPDVQALLRDTNQQFDVVIVEWMFTEVYAGFAAIFDAPFIWVSTVEPHWMVLRLIDEMPNPAYTSDTMSSNIRPASFYERVEQLVLQVMGQFMRYYLVNQLENDVYNSLTPYFKMRGREPPVFEDLKFNASLMLGNSHVSLGQPMSLPPNYHGVGGYHIDTNVAPLPKDLQNLLDNAKNGVIYFSMGSNLQSKDMPQELKASLLKMFGTLKQTVLWKFEEVLPNLPSNVHIVKWAPQPSILAHPKCILFITHGGLLSTTEAVHYAKPIIGIPVFADQFVNVNRAVKKGFAKKVDLSYTMASELKATIEDIIQDPTCSNKVKELSFIYHHRPTPPGAELVHWVEHVVKTGGARHLRSPALSVPFYQKTYLDLAALILAVLFLIRAALRRIFKKSSKKVKTN